MTAAHAAFALGQRFKNHAGFFGQGQGFCGALRQAYTQVKRHKARAGLDQGSAGFKLLLRHGQHAAQRGEPAHERGQKIGFKKEQGQHVALAYGQSLPAGIQRQLGRGTWCLTSVIFPPGSCLPADAGLSKEVKRHRADSAHAWVYPGKRLS